jgi:hypothetical protein
MTSLQDRFDTLLPVYYSGPTCGARAVEIEYSGLPVAGLCAALMLAIGIGKEILAASSNNSQTQINHGARELRTSVWKVSRKLSWGGTWNTSESRKQR